jgi:hypothetical protein
MPEIRKLNQVEQSPVHIVSVSSGEVRPMQEVENVIIYAGGIPQGGQPGDIITKKTDIDYEIEWVTPSDAIGQDDHRPITAAAIYALLADGFIIDGGDASFVAGGG